eukprot:2186083-Pyramimonas_sp.AAC.1
MRRLHARSHATRNHRTHIHSEPDSLALRLARAQAFILKPFVIVRVVYPITQFGTPLIRLVTP